VKNENAETVMNSRKHLHNTGVPSQQVQLEFSGFSGIKTTDWNTEADGISIC